MEMSNFRNEQPQHEQKCSGNTALKERRTQLLILSFGILCIIQVVLNISLRLTFYSNESSSLDNKTHFCDQKPMEGIQCEENGPGSCYRIQRKLSALTRDKKLLENRNSELMDTIKRVMEERDRLQMNLEMQIKNTNSQKCPADWRMINSKCYFLSSQFKTWQQSRNDCQYKGSDLVVIDSEQEQAALAGLLGDAIVTFWIGLYNINGIFTWVDRSALTKPFWQTGKLDNNDDIHPNLAICVKMSHSNQESGWNNATCSQKHQWVCEKNPDVIA